MRRFTTQVDLRSVTRSSVGRIGEPDFRLFFHSRDGRPMSPWHDIPVPSLTRKDEWFPFVCEIPKGHTEKMEVNLSEKFNPIAQDVKNGKPRYLPIKPRFNYGMMPQTFETPKKKCLVTGLFGDGDPIDVVDISSTAQPLGSIIPVKLLGSFCFVDSGEADWKIIVASNQNDEINSEILKVMFGFFENYKGPNSGNYIFDDKRLFSVTETIDILRQANENYQELLNAYRMTRSGGESDEEEPINVWVPGNDRI